MTTPVKSWLRAFFHLVVTCYIFCIVAITTTITSFVVVVIIIIIIIATINITVTFTITVIFLHIIFLRWELGAVVCCCHVITLTLVVLAVIHCKLGHCLPVLSITCSIYSMVALAEERYR